jgi:hypothetical protein
MTIYKYIAIILAIAGTLFGFFLYGYEQGKDKKEQEVIQYKSALEAADNLARTAKLEGEQNAKKIGSDYLLNLDALKSYYDGLLQKARNSLSPSTIPACPKISDESPSQSTITGCPIQIEQRCAQDALTVKAFQEYVLVNHIPVQ